jgi:meiotically up-regulated gene 157 (Mug157) protein
LRVCDANGQGVFSSRRPALAAVLALALPLAPSAALAQTSAVIGRVIIPGSAINAETIVLPTSRLFHTESNDFFAEPDGTIYVQTGDIPAMWLRDSSAQSKPYVRFAQAFPKLKPLARAVIERNAKNVLIDPYANAFTAGYKVWEEKWEVDSLAYPVTLAYTYWRRTGDRAMFSPRLHWAFERTLQTYQCEQHHARCSHYTTRFLPNGGQGAACAETGMIWSAFRPSDDPVRYCYNIPQEMFVVVALHELAEMATPVFGDSKLAAGASRLADEINAGIERHGTVLFPGLGEVYAYEVDGYGRFILMDDANLPNLLAATYYGYSAANDPIYLRTRRFVLSSANPYFYNGKYATGLGSPHTPTGWVWPLGLIARGLTAQTPFEAARVVSDIAHSDLTDGLIHESFDPNDPSRFTRAEFGWGNALYAELIFRSCAGFDPDPLPAPVQPSFGGDIARTPVIVEPPEIWLNAENVYDEARSLLQE